MDNEFYISQSNWNKIINYAGISYNEYKAEIGGMSVMVEDKDGDWELKDPVILKQIVTAGNTHLDKDELATYYTKTAQKYAKKNFRFCWWHSHHTMDAFWSGTDTNTIDEFSDGDFSFALVVNLKEEYKFRVSIWKPFPMHKDVELNILCHEKKFPAKLVDEVKELCSKPEINYKGIGRQRTLWHQQRKAGNVINYTTPVDVDDLIDEGKSYDYTQAYELLMQLMAKTADGTLTEASYISQIQDFNNHATKEETGIVITQLTWQQWEESIQTNTPTNYIVDTEIDSWNNSFDYHKRWGI